MTVVDLTNLANQASVPRISRVDASELSGRRFAAAMQDADVAATTETQQINRATNTPGSKPAADNIDSAPADAAERARRALDLNPSQSSQTKINHGDSILHGLQRLNGIFAAQEAHINNLSSRPAADTNTLLSMQMEVAKFSILVDVTSKLTGKSTQILDTLMKGQ